MTSIKKVVAIVLAFLMIFSSASVLASAKVVTSFDSDKTALSIETKFFKDGEPVERVKPGDEVKARVYVGTDYYSNDSTLLFFYDKDFFDHNYTTGAAVVSNNSGVKGYINPTPDLSSQAYLTEDYLNQYGAMVVNLEVDSVNNVMFDASDWLVEITFTVKDDAGTTTENIVGDLFVNPATIQNTEEEGIDAVISVPKGPEAGTDADLWPMWLWDADVTLNSTPVTSESTVTFNANGGAFETGDADSQSYTGTIETDAVPVQAEPVRAGYTFLGWDDASDETETAGEQPEKFQYDDLVLNAVWVKNVNITFETGEGGTEIPALLDKTPGTEFPAIADPTRDGYTFRGWEPALPDVYPEEDTTYTAIWKLNVTMSFDTLGGTEIEDKHGFDGQEFDPNTVPKPEKEGYIFRNWSPALPTAYPEQDTTYTAVYEARLYTVKFYIVENGVATLKRAARVEFDSKIPTDIVDDLIPEGYVLNGWYTDESLQTPLADDAVMGTEVISLYASFEVEAYDATFDAAGGYFDGDETKTEVKVNTVFEENIKAPADPTREGYVFKGWTPSVGVMDTVGGKRFYATWDLEENKVAYLWNNTDAPKTDYEIFDIAYGDSVDMPADPDLEGYTFIGWGATADATEEAEIPATMPAGNLTYYAIWEVNKYDVTFNANEGYLDGDETKLTQTENLDYKAAITAPKAERKGYDFVGWATTANATADDVVTVKTNVPANDLTYYAVWEARTDTTYKVEYYTQGIDGEYVLEKTDDTLTGETATTATAPALEGVEGKFYLTEHKDQLLEAEIAGDGSTVLKAYYARYKYTYTFTNTGDSTVADINAYYDAPIDAPENPSWVGHTWVDWNPVLPEKMGTADATFEGTWTVNNYTVTFYANDGYLNGDKALTEKPETVPFGGKITVPEAKRDGYTFAGWAASADSDVKVDVPEIMGDEPNGLKFYAIWTANTDTTYKVEYYMQGIDGVYVLDTEKSFETAGETDTDATAPELEGLENMFTLNTAHADSNITDNINGDGSTVLKVYYSRDKHTYTFTNTGDTTIAPMELYYGAPVTEPVPTMEGHDWDGWTPDVPKTMGTTNMTFTGNWTTLKYTATFHANSKGSTDAYFGTADVVTKPVETYYGNPINAPKATRPGYNFKGWSTTDGGAVTTLPSTMPAKALEYYAVWEASEGTSYTVEYYIQNTQGEYVIDNSKTLYPTGVTGDTVTAPALENIDGKFYLTTHEGQLLESTIAGDGSTVLKAYYARNQYTFKAYIDGAEVVSETYYYDAIVATPDDPAKVGYAWDNTWYSDADCTAATTVPSNMPATDVTVYAKLVAQDVTVTIVVNYEDQINGGSQTVSVNTYKGKADSTIQIVDEIPATPAENTTYILVADLPSAESTAVSELSHYQYDAANAENAGFNATNTKVNADGSTVINVYYAPVSYTIMYMNESGEWDSKTITYGAALELPATEPKKDGYDFLGWYLGEDKAETTDIVTGNKTYIAKYENIDYTIDYEVTGDIPESFTAPTDITNAHIGDPVVATEPNEVPGYTFSGWTVEGAVDGKVGTSNVTVTGSWAYIPYTVTYVYAGDVPAGQTAPAVVNTHIGETVGKPAITQVPGYTVTEWVLEGDVDGKVGTNNVTATATWAYIPYTITYVYAGDVPAGQKAPDAVSTHIGETVGKPAITEVPGYTVTEWVLSGDVDGKVGADNVTATATWAYINYTIDYEVTGDAPESFTAPTDITNAHIGDPVVATEPEKVPGYTFSGWTVEGAVDGKVGTSNVTVTGSWTHDEYSVTYTFTGDVPADANKPADRTNAHYGDAIDLTLPNAVDGYTFEGWVVSGAAADNTVAEADVTVTGNWKYDSVGIIYTFAGVTPPAGYEEPADILDAHIGQIVAVPTMTAPAGYTLVWTVSDTAVKDGEGNYTVGTETVTVTGTWAYIPYTITYVYAGDVPAGQTAPAVVNTHIGETVGKPAITQVPGYTVTEWALEGDVDGKVGAGNVTATATWAYIPYTITYVYAGDVPAGQTAPAVVNTHIGETVGKPAITEVPGYTVTEWVLSGDVDGKVGAGNVTATATWAYINYTIDYEVTGDAPESFTAPTDITNAHIGDPVVATEPEKVPGYTFSGWTVEGAVDGKVGTSNVTVTGSWTHDEYSVTYTFTGDVPADANKPADRTNAHYGDAIDLTVPNTIEGFTFGGWVVSGAAADNTVAEADVTVTGNWTRNSHKVIFNAMGGSPVEEATYSYGATIAAPEATTRPGFGFLYWYETDENTKFDFANSSMPDHDVTLYAKWQANGHTITFDSNGGTAVDQISSTFGTKVEAPTAPTRDGYTFAYWYETDEKTEFGFPYIMEDRNVELTAKWNVVPVTINYVFTGTVPPSVTEPDDVTAKIGDNVDLTDNYDVYGYIFEGWNSVEGAVDNGDGTYTVGTETEITVTGNWKLQQFTVTFDSKGGTAVESVTQNYNTVVSEPFPAPTKTGHDFGEWVIAGTTDAYDFSAPLVKDVALEATWTPILYTITFNSNGGTAVDKIEAYYGDDISAKLPLDENMKKEGYTFAGWLKGNADYELPATMPAESFRLDANWVAAGDTLYTKKVFLMDTTGVYVEATEEQSTGSGTTLGTATFDAPATREGFTLNAGKSTLTGTIVADGSLVLSAYYDRNQHSVTFSNTYDTAYVGDTAGTYYYDSLITAPSNVPVREGYSFAGWYTNVDDETTKLVAGTTVVPDSAVTYVAKWTVNPYTITYVSDGDAATVPGVATFNYGVETEEPATKPTKTGYTFSHWYETDEAVKFVFGEAMPARNITLNAAWTANDVTVKYVFDGRVPTEAVLPETITNAHIGDVIDLTAPAGVYGYEFQGWTVEGAVDGKVYTEDVTVTGTWTINSYTITFDSKGGTAVAPITQEYKTVVAEPTDPTKTGHTFNKWVIAGTTTEYDFTAPLTADVTLEAVWDTNTYTITYVTGEGATQIPAKDYLYGATTAAPSEPQKTGYTFSHWYEGEDATAKFVFGEAMPARNITLNAAFTANNVSITYAFTGNVPASAVKPADKADAHIGDVIDVTEPAAVAGYEFKGWTVEGANKNDNGEYVVDTRAVTVTGNWVINSYTIKFTDYDDTVLAEGTFVYNSAITIKPATDPSREGYTFLGYYATIDGEEVKFVDGATVPAANTTYVAKYDINSYNLTFTANGTELYSGKVEYGKELASYIPDSATVPSKDGYRFAGWALAADADTAVAVASKMPANDLSYVAVYESSIYNVYYYVKVVDGNDSTADAYKLVSTSRVEYGAVISENSNYTPAEGFEFSGWYKDEGLNTALAAGETMGNGKLSLYATETAIICDAVFEANGGKFADDATSITVPTFFEQDIIAPAAPTRKGYTFVGWTPVVGVMDSVDGKTFKAQWAAIDGAFTATYYVDGEEYEVYALAAGDSLDVPADPDKSGYEFLGWAPASVADPTEADIVSLEGKVMPADNVAYNAVFKAVSANATFYEYKDSDLGPAKNPDIGYDVYEQTAYIFGDTIEMPAVPVLYNTAGQSIDAYYTFQHWVDDEGNTYAADAVIEMTGAINFYPVYERVTVKLVPVEGSTTMIERYVGGAEVIESYNDGYTVTADRYTADSGFDKWFIYGLPINLDNNNDILDSYIKVNGDGYYDVEYITGSAIGTGVKISVYDNFDTSAPVEEFHIVIYGDVTGDGFILAADANIVKLVVNNFTSLDAAWLFRAADVTRDGFILAADANIVRLVVNNFAKLNQVTGLAE